MDGLSCERGAALVDGAGRGAQEESGLETDAMIRSATVAKRSARFARLRGLDHEEEEAQEGQVGHREH
jgi:hypothetical protein